MIIISFPNGTDWYKANWVFRQLAEDVIETYSDDAELEYALKQAQALGGLPVELMDSDLAARTLRALRTVARRTVEGTVPGWTKSHPQDEKGQAMYLEAIRELLDILEAVDKK